MITATTVDVMAEPQRLDGRRARREQNVDAVVDAMLDWCSVGPSAARVDRVVVSDATPDRSLAGFEVR